jgi:hypothetical protein
MALTGSTDHEIFGHAVTFATTVTVSLPRYGMAPWHGALQRGNYRPEWMHAHQRGMLPGCSYIPGASDAGHQPQLSVRSGSGFAVLQQHKRLAFARAAWIDPTGRRSCFRDCAPFGPGGRFI